MWYNSSIMKEDNMTISIEKYKWLSEQQHNAILESDKVNDEIAKSLAGNEGERMIARLVNGIVVHDDYDVLSIKETKLSNGLIIKPGKYIEVKTAILQTDGQITAYSLDSKRHKCHYIALVDMTGEIDNIRISIIPEPEFFSEGEFGRYKDKPKERFSWSGSYNESDNKRPVNTDLFKSYEVKYERIT